MSTIPGRSSELNGLERRIHLRSRDFNGKNTFARSYIENIDKNRGTLSG